MRFLHYTPAYQPLPGAFSQCASVHILQMAFPICPGSQDFEAANISHSSAAAASWEEVPWPCSGLGQGQWHCKGRLVLHPVWDISHTKCKTHGVGMHLVFNSANAEG